MECVLVNFPLYRRVTPSHGPPNPVGPPEGRRGIHPLAPPVLIHWGRRTSPYRRISGGWTCFKGLSY